MDNLYENQELVYEKQMASLKKRIVFVNSVIFVSNFIATLILIINQMAFIDFLHIVFPVFMLNLLISYAILINKDSNEQLHLAMYISIIGTIVVMIGIFVNVKNPATYMLIYLAIAIISVFRDKKAVGLGYLIIFIFGSIINFLYIDYIIIEKGNTITYDLMPYLYEGILVIILLVQAVRAYHNDKEIDDLYLQLETQKEVELQYHNTIFNLIDSQELINYTNNYVNNNTKERLYNYIEVFNKSFLIKEDLKVKVDRYLDLQLYRNPKRILGKRLGSYMLKKELNHYEEMSTYNLTKLFSLVLSITYKNLKVNNIDNIKNYEFLFMNPDMSLETKIIGFIILYEHLRNDKPHFNKLTHEQIIAYLKTNEAKDIIDKEILEFFITNEAIFNNIYETSNKAVDLEQEIEDNNN